MSLEIPREQIESVYRDLAIEGAQDYLLVSFEAKEAEGHDRSLDGAFEEELAEKRRQKALDRYAYPVEGTGPTPQSSLRIVRDILKIRELDLSSDERLAGVDLRGQGDIALHGALGLERSHRLWEKGILRIFDQHTSRSMWSVEFDASIAAS